MLCGSCSSRAQHRCRGAPGSWEGGGAPIPPSPAPAQSLAPFGKGGCRVWTQLLAAKVTEHQVSKAFAPPVPSAKLPNGFRQARPGFIFFFNFFFASV